MYKISVNIRSVKELRYESSMDETSISLLFYSKPCVVQGLRRWQSINPKIEDLKPSGINYLQCFKWMRCSLYHNMPFSWISHIEHDQCISWWWLGFMHPKCIGTQLLVPLKTRLWLQGGCWKWLEDNHHVVDHPRLQEICTFLASTTFEFRYVSPCLTSIHMKWNGNENAWSPHCIHFTFFIYFYFYVKWNLAHLNFDFSTLTPTKIGKNSREMLNRNEAWPTTLPMKSGHISKLKVVMVLFNG